MRSSTNCVRRAARLFAAGLLVLSAGALGASAVTEGSQAAGMTSCVEPTDVMRRNHMEFLKHQRDETVHNGIRGAKHSLSACVDCHASITNGQSKPINDQGEFCAGCHEFTAVSIDCFQCHRTVPREQNAVAQHPAPAIGEVELHDLGARSAMFWLPPGAAGPQAGSGRD